MSTAAHVFDEATLVFFSTPPPELLSAIPGEVVLRINHGITLQQVRDSPLGKKLMHRQNWYDKYAWSALAAPIGTHRLRVPAPGSSRKSYTAQSRALGKKKEVLAPVLLVAISLLCHRVQTEQDLLNDVLTRCAESAGDGVHVVLSWHEGRLSLRQGWDAASRDFLWASSVRS